MTVYIDKDYKCHVKSADGFNPVETDAFDGKCDAFIEGYRFVPSGKSWTREDGVVFEGEMISPWKNYNMLAAAQREYVIQLIAEYEFALSEIETALGV